MEDLISSLIARWGIYGAAFVLLILYRRPIAGWLSGIGAGTATVELQAKLLRDQLDNFAENNQLFHEVVTRFAAFQKEVESQHDTLREVRDIQRGVLNEIKEQGAYMRGKDARQ